MWGLPACDDAARNGPLRPRHHIRRGERHTVRHAGHLFPPHSLPHTKPTSVRGAGRTTSTCQLGRLLRFLLDSIALPISRHSSDKRLRGSEQVEALGEGDPRLCGGAFHGPSYPNSTCHGGSTKNHHDVSLQGHLLLRPISAAALSLCPPSPPHPHPPRPAARAPLLSLFASPSLLSLRLSLCHIHVRLEQIPWKARVHV